MELQRLRNVFRAALELPDDVEVDNLEYRGIEKWDSLAHMSLVASIEDEFGVMLDTDEVIDLSSFDRARQILEKHGVVLSD
ncbi:acyl carrier protein [Micromonospora globbae]|uniref:Acyl carrier protein n=1 Tax=Micromonospora globbae TaxID=1894969 RepID=A0A420F1Y9_9ACTN|nr:phosphopantetheine-binding protein [Micromonospora globbae]RKF27016.1 acyl carrier protein [Micromonospora globbae]WTF88213.1 phosphopantetheine-binding protein [Micromonospora globbae]